MSVYTHHNLVQLFTELKNQLGKYNPENWQGTMPQAPKNLDKASVESAYTTILAATDKFFKDRKPKSWKSLAMQVGICLSQQHTDTLTESFIQTRGRNRLAAFEAGFLTVEDMTTLEKVEKGGASIVPTTPVLIEDIIEESKHESNLEITRGIQAAIMQTSEEQFAKGKLVSPNWHSAMGDGGMHVFIPFGEEQIPLPLPIPTVSSELYYYQKEALEILKLLVQDKYEFNNEHFRELIINLPTGAGKTRIFNELLAWWKGFKITVIAAPTISLLRQIEHGTKSFLKDRGCDFEYKVVCSDKKLSDEEMQSEEDQDIINIMLQHGEATTNLETIRTMLQGHSKELVIFATYKSLAKIAEACRDTGVRVDLLIGDEGHRMCDKEVNQNLHDYNFPVQYKAFFTATVREKISNTDLLLEYPMTSTEYFGPVAYKKTPQELIDEGFILPIKLLPTKYDSEYVEEIQKLLDKRMVGIKEDVKHEFALYLGGLIHVYNATGKIKNITFVQSIETADWYERNFAVVVDIINAFAEKEISIQHSTISQRVQGFDRVKMLNAFDEAENAIMFNYQVIKEGIDIKDCNSITWLRKMDAVGLVQSMGRAMRIDYNDPSKTCGYVICPFNTDTKQKGAAIERMKVVAETLLAEGYSDIIVSELNNSNRKQGDGSKGRRNVRDIDFGNMTPEEIVKLLEHVIIVDGEEVIDPLYYMTDRDNEIINNILDT